MNIYVLDKGVIDKNTPLKPKNYYKMSKLQGERLIENLSNTSFNIVIIRPPMIYGKDCKENYQRLKKQRLKLLFFQM